MTKSQSDKLVYKQPWNMVVAYSLFNITLTMSLTFVMAVLLPKQVLEMVGDASKASKLGQVVMFAAVMYTITGPLTGFISDKVAKKSRLPFIFVGCLLWSLSVIVRPVIVTAHSKSGDSSKPLWLLFYAVITGFGKMFYAIIQTPYVALLPDFFPPEQYNSISAVVGCSNLFGVALGVVGLGLVYPYIAPFYLCLLVSSVLVLSLLALIPFQKHNNLDARGAAMTNYSHLSDSESDEDDQPVQNVVETIDHEDVKSEDALNDEENILAEQEETDHSIGAFLVSVIKPFRSWSFSWVFITRFIMTLGNSSLRSFFLYFIRDTMGPIYTFIVWSNWPKSDEQAQALFLAITFVMSVVSSLASSFLADVFGKRLVVFASGILCALAAAITITTLDYNVMLLCGILLGLGAGAYVAVDLSLVNCVLPDHRERAKDLAIWNISQNVPDLLATPLFGAIIDKGNQLSASGKVNIRSFGYVLQFIISIFLFVSASGLIWCVYLPDDRVKLFPRRTTATSFHRTIPVEEVKSLEEDDE